MTGPAPPRPPVSASGNWPPDWRRRCAQAQLRGTYRTARPGGTDQHLRRGHDGPAGPPGLEWLGVRLVSDRPRVVCTDPAWAVDESGAFDPDRADVERDVFGTDIFLDFAPYDHGYLAGERLLDTMHGADGLVIYRCQVTE